MEKKNPSPRERRSKIRLSDVERIVDNVLPKHMPEVAKPKKTQRAGERRGVKRSK